MSTAQEGIDRMSDLARRQPLRQLADALAVIDAMPKWDDAHRLTRMVLIDVICERCPEADAAFQAWADSEDCGIRNGSAAIVNAVRALRKRASADRPAASL